MSRGRKLGAVVLAAVVVALLVAGWRLGFERVERWVDLPPRGEAAYNPLYALKLALRADGQRVDSRQRLQLQASAPGPRDTVLLLADPDTLGVVEAAALLAWVEGGGHLVMRMPASVRRGSERVAPLLAALPVTPRPGAGECLRLQVAGEPVHREFCGDPRFDLAPEARSLAGWSDADGRAFVRLVHGAGSIDLLAGLDFLLNGKLGDGAHRALARQLLAPHYGAGTFHLVYAADMPPLWRWLLERAWMALLPALLALLAWLWARGQRFGPLRPAPAPGRRSLLEHVQASGEHLHRYGRLAPLHRALREAVLARLRRRDPLAAALEDGAQAAAVAARTGLPAAEVTAALDTRPPFDAKEFRARIAGLIALRNRL